MTTAHLTGHDVRVRDAVQHQLEWSPDVDASTIAAVAQGGVVTLTGYVDTYAAKLAAERAAKSVRGVRAVANDIEVRPKLERTDADIARDAVQALALRGTVPDAVQVAVHDHHITLTGRVGWLYQRYDAEQAVRHVKGVRGVFNHIDVAKGGVRRDVRHRIVEALHRNADVDARHITVDVEDDRAVLRGTVTTFLQRETAETAAASAPGITRVENHITVEPAEVLDEIC